MTATINAQSAPLLEAVKVTIEYDTQAARKRAVHEVSFRVFKGDILTVLGRSGCGKSTLLKAVGGFQPISGGSLTLDGKPIIGPGPDRMVVWQESEQLFPWLTALANVEYPMLLNKVPAKEARARALDMMEKAGLGRAVNDYPHSLSGGMKMRVAIARALAMRPAVLLMDEPFAALDALTRSKMQDELLCLQKATGATIIFVTHEISEAVKLGSQQLILSPHPGQVLAKLDSERYADKRELEREIDALIHQADAADAEH